MGASAPVKYHYFQRYFTYSMKRSLASAFLLDLRITNPSGRHCQVGSLAGAAHLLNNNAGVLR